MKKERLIRSFSFIDEKYVKEAEPKMKNSFSFKKFIGIAASFAIIVALGLYLFMPFKSGMMDLTAYSGSDYFPLIEKIEDYRYTPPKYKNNFESITAGIKNFGAKFDDALNVGMGGAMAPGDAENSSTADGADNNGSYEEVTDNQVAGVIEADIFKRTDKYIFRVTNSGMAVYSIAGEESEKISEVKIPILNDEYSSYIRNVEMYLSEDANTVTIIKQYTNRDNNGAVGIISLDVSDVKNITTKGTISIDGSYNSSRMVDGKLLLISEYYFNANKLDYAKPETYVPSIDRGNGKECMKFEDITFPETVGHNRYSVVALIDEGTLDVLGANALLNFTDDIYVSGSNVYVTREYTKKTDVSETEYTSETYTDIAILGYDGTTLTEKGIISVAGAVKDQYSLDEYEGHLRVVASTAKSTFKKSNRTEEIADADISVSFSAERNVSLYVFKLEDNSLVAEVKDFAPAGESAESVRFDGNTAYVCTAIVVTFTDPVYFFDLSDYSNITYTDTGVIDGYSTSLINLGEGFLLGIGVENWKYNKVEVYEQIDGSVESVDKYTFVGNYSVDYKSYLVNREENLFGFAVSYYYNEETMRSENVYVLLVFNGYELEEVALTEFGSYNPGRVRAAYVDGYLYLTSDDDFKVVNLNK